MATLQDIRDQLADLMQRDDQSDAQLDRFIDSALERTSQVLVSVQAETLVQPPYTGTAGVYTLPDDYARVRTVFQYVGSRTVELKPLSGIEAARYDSVGEFALGYRVVGLTLRVFPRVSSEVGVVYQVKPAALTTGASTNYLTDIYPRIVLYGAAVEAALWERDMQSKQAFELEYAAAVDQANQEAERARYGAAPVAASHYQAPGGITRGM